MTLRVVQFYRRRSTVMLHIRHKHTISLQNSFPNRQKHSLPSDLPHWTSSNSEDTQRTVHDFNSLDRFGHGLYRSPNVDKSHIFWTSQTRLYIDDSRYDLHDETNTGADHETFQYLPPHFLYYLKSLFPPFCFHLRLAYDFSSGLHQSTAQHLQPPWNICRSRQ